MNTAGRGARPKRSERVAERVKSELMDLLIRGVIRDPAVEGCYVSSVRVTEDLQQARVYVRLTQVEGHAPRDGEADKRARQAAVEALNRASGFIRKMLSPRLKLKHQPELTFFWDETFDHAARVDALLREIADEESGLSEPVGGDDE